MDNNEKEALLKELEAKELIIDNLVKMNLSLEEDRKSLLDEIAKTYLVTEEKPNANV